MARKGNKAMRKGNKQNKVMTKKKGVKAVKTPQLRY